VTAKTIPYFAHWVKLLSTRIIQCNIYVMWTACCNVVQTRETVTSDTCYPKNFQVPIHLLTMTIHTGTEPKSLHRCRCQCQR